MTETSAEILTPFGRYLTPGANPDVIEILREALDMAERGEVVAVAIAAINQTGFVKTRATKGNRGMGEIVGAVAVMQDDLIRLWKES